MIDIILDEKGLSFNSLEKEFFILGCQYAREMLKDVFEEMDKNWPVKGIKKSIAIKEVGKQPLRH